MSLPECIEDKEWQIDAIIGDVVHMIAEDMELKTKKQTMAVIRELRKRLLHDIEFSTLYQRDEEGDDE